MIDRQTTKDWERTAEMLYDNIFGGDEWVYMVALKENKFIRKIIEAIEKDQQTAQMSSPCDLCKFAPYCARYRASRRVDNDRKTHAGEVIKMEIQ